MNHRFLRGIMMASVAGLSALPAPARPPAPMAVLAGSNGVSLAALVTTRPVDGGTAYAPPALLSDAYMNRLHASGADLVRLVTRPTPLLTGSPTAQAMALRQVIDMVHRLNRAGLAVIVDPHFWPPDTAADEASVVCDPARRAVYRAMLLTIADALADVPTGHVALELLNEPKPCRVDGQIAWPAVQQQLVQAIRARHRQLPLVVTGSIGGLDPMSIDPAPYRADPAILYSWHYYDPFIFTHQQIYYKLAGVPWPAPATVIDGMKAYAAIDRSNANLAAANTLLHYLTQDGGAAAIHARFAAAADWAHGNHIPVGNIVIGEYGVPLQSVAETEALRNDKVRWLSTVRTEARRAGFRSIYWAMPLHDGYDYDARTMFLRAEDARAIGLTPPP